jgi:hypothetical protein
MHMDSLFDIPQVPPTYPLKGKRVIYGLEQLSNERPIQFLPPETMKPLFLAMEVYPLLKEHEAHTPNAYLRKIIFDDREGTALRISSNYGRMLNVAVYGGAHDWRDNIYTWNQKNPHNKMALIEITPNTLISPEEDNKVPFK